MKLCSCWIIVGFVCQWIQIASLENVRFPFVQNKLHKRYGKLSDKERNEALNDVKNMFWFAFNNYMRHAYPMDELDPIHCTGRGPDYTNPDNININDSLGEYSLTLIDSLTSLAIFGNKTELHNAVRLVIDYVSFHNDVTVQVFEATIRVIGSLLSTHMLLTNENPHLGDFTMEDYDGYLLTMAHDLAIRLSVAFENTTTKLPYPRVNLMHGILPGTINETCTAGAGSLLLEFGILSKLLDDNIFEKTVRNVNAKLWDFRNKDTNLLGNVIDVQSGLWKGTLSGTGAGIDSFYEYLFKSFIMFGSKSDYEKYAQSDESLDKHLRQLKSDCGGTTSLPFYANVDMRDGSILNTWVDSLQASHSGLKVLAGDVNDAVWLHGFYYALWRKYEGIPERFNWQLKQPEVLFYPLRPEFVESTYFLYRATKSPFYQRVGLEIINALNKHTRVACGYATVHSVLDKSLEDRMESFFLSETCKYLYLLFDEENPANINEEKLLFSTEGHIFPILHRFQTHLATTGYSSPNTSCEAYQPMDDSLLPFSFTAFEKLSQIVGGFPSIFEDLR